jgi:general secretion pathway protein A
MEILNNYSYVSFFNFKAPPFSLVPDPSLFFPGKAHLETLEVFTFSINQGSLFSVLTGEPGLGKTQILLTLLTRLPEDLKKILIYNPSLSPEDFFKTLFKELALKDLSKETLTENPGYGGNKDEILKILKNFFDSGSSPFKRCLLIIDEAQLLPLETLEELRLLTNLNQGSSLFLQILLIGQPTLAEKLKRTELSPLRQRISVWETLKPLEKEEILPYLWFRIKQVSESPEINFERKIEKKIFKWTQGIPRLVNKLMDRALFVAYVKREKIIRKAHLKEAKKTFPEGLLES